MCSSCLVGRGVGTDTSLTCAAVDTSVCRWRNERSVGVRGYTRGVQVCSRSRYAGLASVCGCGNPGSCPPLGERRPSRDWEPFVPPQSLGGILARSRGSLQEVGLDPGLAGLRHPLLKTGVWVRCVLGTVCLMSQQQKSLASYSQMIK